MTDSDDNSEKLKEILVALDHSYHSRTALETAAIIAQLLQARIHGIFVRDPKWLRLSELPSLVEVEELTGRLSSVGRKSIEQEIRSLEKTIREHFELISRQHELSHTWSSAEGKVAEKILEAAEDSDIITIGSRGRSYSKSRSEKIGSTALTILQKAEKPVLILQKSYTPERSPIVVFDGSERSVSGLSFASDVAEKNETSFAVIDISEAFPVDDHKYNLKETLTNEREAQIVTLQQADMGRFLFLVNSLRGGIVILPKTKRFTKRNVLELILDTADSPVLLTI
ncbi:universal stress protein [Rhodohalobacter sp. 8-1]|uniref:universal stress protein n=1 Tax=Rhodohalobacter sp. 8-1 TaxID=3131972 RepID=UPI0030EE138D